MNGYSSWLQAMPSDESILAWQAEGRSKGYFEAMPADLRSGVEKLVPAYAGRPMPKLKLGELPWPEPEDRGTAVLSALGDVEYVEDLIRPGRIVTWAAEEGSGKSYAVDDELSMRVAVAGGSFAGTWPVTQTGPVLVLSEMHADDDFAREETTLGSLGLKRGDLAGRYFRLVALWRSRLETAFVIGVERLDWAQATLARIEKEPE
jgi:hypothetical protein